MAPKAITLWATLYKTPKCMKAHDRSLYILFANTQDWLYTIVNSLS
jgi:hypothetical protein